MRDLRRELQEHDWVDIEKALEDLPDGYRVVSVETTKEATCPDCGEDVEVIVEMEAVEEADHIVTRAVMISVIEQIEEVLDRARNRRILTKV